MRYGNIYKTRKPTEDDLEQPGVCSMCKEPCERAVEDMSYDDHFGTIYDYRIVSNCCCAEVLDPGDDDQ